MMSRGSRSTSLHNASHFYHLPLAAADLLVYITLVLSSAVAQKLSWKQVCLVGSTVVVASYVGKLCPCERALRRQ